MAMGNIRTIYYAIVILLGIYLFVCALQMKRKGEVSTFILAKEEQKKCRDEEAYVAFVWWRMAAFGAALIPVGALGLVNDLLLGSVWLRAADLLMLLAACVWFFFGLGKAKERYL